MTEPDNNCCVACGRTKVVEFKQQTAYHVSFYAPAGICREVIIADTPQHALDQARVKVAIPSLKAEDFDPIAESYCVRQIIVEHPDGDEVAVWTDPDNIQHLHADEILELLEDMIEIADQLAEERQTLDTRISDMVCCGEESARTLQNIRRKGGAQ